MSAPKTAIRHRGEVPLTLGDTCYCLRPSFTALAAVEAQIGSLISLVERAGSGGIKLTEIIVLLHACAKAGGHDIGQDAFAAQVLAAGAASTVQAVRRLLEIMMTGDG
ncbi:MAG: GTA-gp10 family protein [Sphingomonadales bacterium]